MKTKIMLVVGVWQGLEGHALTPQQENATQKSGFGRKQFSGVHSEKVAAG
jgi:hypothetical protein